MSWGEFHVGLPKPEKEREVVTDLNAMRKAIAQGQRDSALIRNCLNQAEYAGLSGEDKYVLLAFHALRMLEDTHRQLSSYVALSPMVPKIPKPVQP